MSDVFCSILFACINNACIDRKNAKERSILSIIVSTHTLSRQYSPYFLFSFLTSFFCEMNILGIKEQKTPQKYRKDTRKTLGEYTS
jgi:hypothetical protein